jgi:hypothetical protein
MKQSTDLKVATVVVIGILGAAVYAQEKFDKYALKSPGGIAFADFRGYEDWAVISVARTDEEVKAILGNPAIIQAFRSGIPANGKPFPEGSRIAKVQWKHAKSKEAPFVVDVPTTPTQAFFMVKDSQKYQSSGGWGYAVFNHDNATGKMTPDAALADCGHVCHVAVKNKDYVFHPYQVR